MNRRIDTASLLMLILIGTLGSGSSIHRVSAAGNEYIYIRADGSIDCTNSNYTVPIFTADNVTYTFTSNIKPNYTIAVERDNIIIDGDNFTLEGEINYARA